MVYFLDKYFLEWAQDQKWFWRWPLKFLLGYRLLDCKSFGVQREVRGRVVWDKLYLSKDRAEEVYERQMGLWRPDHGECVLWEHSNWSYHTRLKEAN